MKYWDIKISNLINFYLKFCLSLTLCFYFKDFIHTNPIFLLEEMLGGLPDEAGTGGGEEEVDDVVYFDVGVGRVVGGVEERSQRRQERLLHALVRFAVKILLACKSGEIINL